MKKLWNNKYFWFSIIILDLFLIFLPFENLFSFRTHRELIEWAPYSPIIAVLFALSLFIIVKFFPSSNLNKFINRVKKVFKIILISVFGFMLFWYSSWFLLQIPFSNSGSWDAAYEYVKKDTSITNKTGTITDYNFHSSSESLNEKAVYKFDAIGQKKNAYVVIELKYTNKWIVDTARYEIE